MDRPPARERRTAPLIACGVTAHLPLRRPSGTPRGPGSRRAASRGRERAGRQSGWDPSINRACLSPLGVSRRFWACPAVRPALRRCSGRLRGGTTVPPAVGRDDRTFSVSRLQSEAAVDPLGNDGPSRPETTLAESVEPPYAAPFGTGPIELLVEAPRPSARDGGSATSRFTQCDRPRRDAADRVRRRGDGDRRSLGSPITDRGVSGLLRPLLRDPPQQSADLGLAVAPMPSQRPD